MELGSISYINQITGPLQSVEIFSGTFAFSSLVLYGIRTVGFRARKESIRGTS